MYINVFKYYIIDNIEIEKYLPITNIIIKNIHIKIKIYVCFVSYNII